MSPYGALLVIRILIFVSENARTAQAQPRAAEVACRNRSRGAACSYEAPDGQLAGGVYQSEGAGQSPALVWGHCYGLDTAAGARHSPTAAAPRIVLFCLHDGTQLEEATLNQGVTPVRVPDHLAANGTSSVAKEETSLAEVVFWVANGGWILLAVLAGVLCVSVCVCVAVIYQCFRDEADGGTYVVSVPVGAKVAGHLPGILPTPLQYARAGFGKRGGHQPSSVEARKKPCGVTAKPRPLAGKSVTKAPRRPGKSEKAERAKPPPIGKGEDASASADRDEDAEHYDITRELREAATLFDDQEVVPFRGVGAQQTSSSAASSSGTSSAAGHGHGSRRAKPQVVAESRGLQRASAPEPLELSPDDPVPRLLGPSKPNTPVGLPLPPSSTLADLKAVHAQAQALAAQRDGMAAEHPSSSMAAVDSSPGGFQEEDGFLASPQQRNRLEEAVSTSARQRKRSASRSRHSSAERSGGDGLGGRFRRSPLGGGDDLEAASFLAPADEDESPAQPMAAREVPQPRAPARSRRPQDELSGVTLGKSADILVTTAPASKWDDMETDMTRCLEEMDDEVSESPFQTSSTGRQGSSRGLALR